MKLSIPTTVFSLTMLCGAAAHATVTLDRIAVVVGKHVIKTSDIDREIRLINFLNRANLDFSPAARRKAADRLIEQELIRTELQVGGYQIPSDGDAVKLLEQIKKQRFQNEAQYRSALQRYGIREEELKSELLWQLTVLRFIDQRFRPGVLVTDEEIKTYYEQHLPELTKASSGHASLEALQPKIRETLEGEQINQQFFAWLDQSRTQARIEFRDEAFQ
jgi:hypothetical protein